MKNDYRNIWFMKIQDVSTFFISEKTVPKIFSTFYVIFKGPPFQYYKVRHPNFLLHTLS